MARVGANDNVEIVGTDLQPNPAIEGWRLTYRLKVKDSTKASDLHAALELDGRRLTETWSFELPPLPVFRIHGGTLSSMVAVQSTLVAPSSIRHEPSA